MNTSHDILTDTPIAFVQGLDARDLLSKRRVEAVALVKWRRERLARTAPIDVAADVYAVGVTLLEVFALKNIKVSAILSTT